jgi:hypothetical protein
VVRPPSPCGAVAPAAAGALAGPSSVSRTGNPHGDFVAVGISTYRYFSNKHMLTNIHILSASHELKPYEKKLRSIAKTALVAVGKALLIKSVEIVFYKNPSGTIPEIGGIGGYTQVANIIFISLDPDNKNFKKAINKELVKIELQILQLLIQYHKIYGRNYYRKKSSNSKYLALQTNFACSYYSANLSFYFYWYW